MAASDAAPDPMVRLRRVLERASAAAALFGGVVLSGAAVFVAVAVASAAFGRPVLGDTEVVELAAGVAVASFMPWCQINNGHVAITTFTDGAPARLRRALDALAAALTVAVVAIIAWRMLQGGVDSFMRNRMSMFLNLPQWWGYAAAALPVALWTLCAAFTFVERLSGRTPDARRPEEQT